MKRLIAGILTLAVIAFGGLALAENAEQTEESQIHIINGMIVEADADRNFLVETLDDGTMVKVLFTETTQEEADWSVGVGDVIVVLYDGTMTEDEPPEITAQRISSFSIEGMGQKSMRDNNSIQVKPVQSGVIIVNLPETYDAESFVDKYVRVFFNGAVALSEPAQISALKVQEIHMETGVVTEIDNDYFLMDWNESQLRVNFNLQSKIADSFDVGDTVDVFYSGIMTRSQPGQIFALAIYKAQ